jgi:ABC-2 type transport system ATP-binding protein
MSGLDPIGRKDVRDLIVEQRTKGTTILFTSHILSDVELLCDRVGIMNRGRMSHSGKLDELLRSARRVEIELADVDESLRGKLEEIAIAVSGDARTQVTVSDEDTRAVLELALASGASVLAVTPSRETLEDLFVRDALSEEASS